jgi:restriction system protein
MIPDSQTLMLPFLRLLKDDQQHTKSELMEKLAKEFGLTDEELKQVLPNSKTGKKIFNNRIHWTQANLDMAGLVTYLGKHQVKISEKGKAYLTENPVPITLQYVRSEYQKKKKKDSLKPGSSTEIIEEHTEIGSIISPEEQISNIHQQLKKLLELELLGKLKAVAPSRFEEIVVQLLVKMGYGGSIAEAGKVTQYTNDEGIDGIIKEDKLGLDVIYIQAKRWDGIVGRPEIQKFVGALAGQRAKKGVFITTSGFSKEAVLYAGQMDTKIILIGGEKLAEYMIDCNLGVSVQDVYEIKKIDIDYFDED